MSIVATPMVGEVRLFPYAESFTNFERTWMPCEGQILPIDQYQMLFAVISSRFGGNGRTNFALPNLNGRTALHWGNGPGLSPRQLGESGGFPTVTLTSQQLPAHNHHLCGNDSAGETGNPTSMMLAKDKQNKLYKKPPVEQNLVSMAEQTIDHQGGGGAHLNLQPYLVMRYFIAHNGVFPSRN
jgi:microcystin-dependent protein